ncbi:ChaN family lipoprotein [Jannaschia sp. 2305UL9-9]|uniref:ChaN family lipoprotein n=1 Tax=Jannaschia sp. 2305UL9-9 TaxID=3121638 RepID=UPI003528C228
MRRYGIGWAAVATAALWCVDAFAADLPDLPPADIYVLGERHDNPDHHVMQGALIARIAPTAIVLEMLTDEQAERLDPDTPRDPQVLNTLFDWADMGWPPIADYMPIFTASTAPILGAAGAPGDLTSYGLDDPLDSAEQTARETLQADAHCGVLPADLLPRFVARQREMDAQFAARTLAAFDLYGGPVVLIAGNGHARSDWGVPAAIGRVRPGVTVVSVVQGEGGRTPPGGDIVLDAPEPQRPDPCDAFR